MIEALLAIRIDSPTWRPLSRQSKVLNEQLKVEGSRLQPHLKGLVRTILRPPPPPLLQGKLVSSHLPLPLPLEGLCPARCKPLFKWITTPPAMESDPPQSVSPIILCLGLPLSSSCPLILFHCLCFSIFYFCILHLCIILPQPLVISTTVSTFFLSLTVQTNGHWFFVSTDCSSSSSSSWLKEIFFEK